MTPPRPDAAELAHVAALVRAGHRGYLLRAARSVAICALLSLGLFAAGMALRPSFAGPAPGPTPTLGLSGTAQLSPTVVLSPTVTPAPQ